MRKWWQYADQYGDRKTIKRQVKGDSSPPTALNTEANLLRDGHLMWIHRKHLRLLIYSFLFERHILQNKREAEKVFHSVVHFINDHNHQSLEFEDRSFFPVPYTGAGFQGLEPSSTTLPGHKQSIRLKGEQSAHKPVPVWDTEGPEQRITLLCQPQQIFILP